MSQMSTIRTQEVAGSFPITLNSGNVCRCKTLIFLINSPDEECSGDQQNGQVDCHCGLEVERFEECGGVGHQQQEEGGEVGGQQLVGEAA